MLQNNQLYLTKPQSTQSYSIGTHCTIVFHIVVIELFLQQPVAVAAS